MNEGPHKSGLGLELSRISLYLPAPPPPPSRLFSSAAARTNDGFVTAGLVTAPVASPTAPAQVSPTLSQRNEGTTVRYTSARELTGEWCPLGEVCDER